MYKIKKMKLGILKIQVILILLVSLTACSTINSGLGSKKGNPKDVSSSYAPELAAAYKAYEEGRLSAAETLFIQYTNKHPNYSEAWFKLGNIYYRTGQYVAAITAYGNVVQQNPQHGKAWYNMALTRVRQAEVTLEKGEQLLSINDIQRQRLTGLKNKIRSGVRQYTPRKEKVIARPKKIVNRRVKKVIKKKVINKRVITTHRSSRYKKK
jgi:tetratricopeptide (TPR) repeat protein